ncbi:MAG TPA: sigma-70 family RNA polymerase sigma factor [Ktedonosporobacter sp.]|nr:sigma-70 family RNA polymerase sigma factor [Ktedonosporobacter sp.]
MKQQRLVALDRTYLATLYQQHAPRIFDYVQRHVSSFQDAEDILIEVFVAALESPAFATLTEQEQQAWLWRVARNKMVDTYRRAQRSRSLPLLSIDEQTLEDGALNPEQISIRQEEDIYLAEQIQRLSPLQQQVLYLRFGEHLRCAQIATRIGKRESSVRSMLSRLMNLLRRQCAEQEEGGNHHGTKR